MCGLRLGQHVRGEQRPCPVVVCGIAIGVQPAVIAQVPADLGLETDFLVQAPGPSLVNRIMITHIHRNDLPVLNQ